MTEYYKLYSSLPQRDTPRAWAEIDLGALRENYRYLKAEAERADAESQPICVVKADAYGHGAPACVRTLLEEGCDFFAVSCLNEAIAVREVCRAAGFRDLSQQEVARIMGLTQVKISREEKKIIQALRNELS